MKHCVQCGLKHPLYSNSRCKECFDAWDAAGRIQSEQWMRDSGWMKVGGTRYSNTARFCRECGARMPDPNKEGSHSRILYALRRGGECVTCDPCHIAARYPTPPCKNPDSPTKSTAPSK